MRLIDETLFMKAFQRPHGSQGLTGEKREAARVAGARMLKMRRVFARCVFSP